MDGHLPESETWSTGWSAALEGDHARAESHFAALASREPRNAEARFQQAIEAGWTAPGGASRFDEVVVGIAEALERAEPGERAELRRRGARALVLLAEVTSLDAAEVVQDAAVALREPWRHLEPGRATLRLLDTALELDPTCARASEVTVRLCDELLARMATRPQPRRRRVRQGWEADVEAVASTRERALRHLAALRGALSTARVGAPPWALRVRSARALEAHDRPTVPSAPR